MSASSDKSPSLFADVDNNEFKKRQKDLFAILVATEKETIKQDSFLAIANTNNSMSQKIQVAKNIRKEYRQDTKNFRKSESIFKKPDRAIAMVRNHFSKNKTPDFKKNPHKWTKYSLSDVTEGELSDKSNTNAALSFLNDLKKHRTDKEDEDVNMNDATEGEEKTDKILFKKKSQQSRRPSNVTGSSLSVNDCTSGTLQYIGSRHVMPEYVIGQNSKQATRKPKNQGGEEKKSNKQIALNHLFEEEEEDDD